MATLIGLVWVFVLLQFASAGSSLTIDTSSGLVTGFVDNSTPNIAQYLGIPFAEPPIGAQRWLPPVLKSRGEAINATAFGYSCPQFSSNKTSVFATDAPEFNIPEPIKTTGEDCLSVNIWAPKQRCSGNELLPVIAWLYGGGFQTGGGSVPYQNPSNWIERTQKHIVVSINYRLNIFGFPIAAGLPRDKSNLGLLDQRLGLEWIRLNIENFGGDPNRIILWGQSAGAVSVDLYNFAYPEDPIISGLIMDSGTALIPAVGYDPPHSNFTFVATRFGCGNLSARAELDCLRQVSSDDIIAFLKERDDSNATPALGFNPIVDNSTRFGNYTERALAGNFTKKPAIIGTVSNEGVAFVSPYDRENGPSNKTVVDYWTFLFLCPAVQTTQNRYAVSVPTFRYLYGGNFSNISPQWWEGAYHSSELPLIFGTSGIARGASTPFEIEVSEKMQDYWLAFAEDPLHGLPKLGWETYEPGNDAVLFGWKGNAAQPLEEERLEEGCDGASQRPGVKPPP